MMSVTVITEKMPSDTELENRLAEGSIDENWRLGIKPNWVLRPDKKMILLVEITDGTFEIGIYYKLYPQAGIILTLLDGKKSVGEVVNEAASLFDSPIEDVRNVLYSLLKNSNKAFTLRGENISQHSYDLNQFIIPQGDIDLNPPRLAAPLSIILHIADSCIRNCLYCNVQKRPSNKKTAMTTGQLLNVIDQAAEMGVLTMSIAGGEPFIRDDIPELIEWIYRNNMKCSFSTKALISPEMAVRLKNAGIRHAQVSIDAPDEKIADFLAGSVGFYKDAVGSIKNLRQAGIQVRTNSMITPFNVKMVDELVELLVSLGVCYIAMSTPSRSLHNGAVSDSLFLNHRDGKWLENEIRQLSMRYGNPDITIKPFEFAMDYSWIRRSDREKRFKNRAFCSAGRSGMLILEDGDVILCEECPVTDELVFGNVKVQSLQEVWDSSRIGEFLHPPREKYLGTVCYDCREYDECHTVKGRCWRESLKAYGQLYAPAPMCPHAPSGKRVM